MNVPEAAIVVGASGFVGRNIVEALRGRVAALIGINSDGRPVPGCTSAHALGQIADMPDFPAPTVLINVAARRYDARHYAHDQGHIFATNVEIVARIYAFCAARKIREVRQASSVAVYPKGTDPLDDAVPLDLNRMPEPGESGYGWSRRMAEVAADLYHAHCGINTITFRLTNPFGPFDTRNADAAHVATAFVLRALSPEPKLTIFGDPDAERDFIYAGDVAAAFVASCAQRGMHDCFNLARGETITIRALAEAVLRATGRDKPIVVAGAARASVRRRRATARRICTAFPDFRLLTLPDALTRTIAWYRREHDG